MLTSIAFWLAAVILLLTFMERAHLVMGGKLPSRYLEPGATRIVGFFVALLTSAAEVVVLTAAWHWLHR